MKQNSPRTHSQPPSAPIAPPPKPRHEAQAQNDRSASNEATDKAKTGEPLRPDERGGRSPKQENL